MAGRPDSTRFGAGKFRSTGRNPRLTRLDAVSRRTDPGAESLCESNPKSLGTSQYQVEFGRIGYAGSLRPKHDRGDHWRRRQRGTIGGLGETSIAATDSGFAGGIEWPDSRTSSVHVEGALQRMESAGATNSTCRTGDREADRPF